MQQHSSSDEDKAGARKLVLLAMAGDQQAFANLVKLHQSRIRKLLLRLCGSHAMADDFAQEAFLKAWRRLPALREADAFGTWLRRIALRCAFDGLRKGGLGIGAEEETAAEDRGGGEDANTRLDIEAALMQLSIPARGCVVLFHAEGMSHQEIADETGLPVGTVKSHIARGTIRLRSFLKPWRPEHE